MADKKVQAVWPVRERVEQLEKEHPKIIRRRQCVLLGVKRSTADYRPAGTRSPDKDKRIKRVLDEIYLKDPCLGSRRLVIVLELDHEEKVNRKRLVRLNELGVKISMERDAGWTTWLSSGFGAA